MQYEHVIFAGVWTKQACSLRGYDSKDGGSAS